MIVGAHLSVAGGLHKALETARGYGFEAVALFVRSPRTWRTPPLAAEAVRSFRRVREETGTRVVVAHASYLVNLAGETATRRKGVDAVAEDLRRCAELGIEYLVLHPGSHPDTETGIRRIVAGLDEAMAAVPRRRVKLLLETMAGQGNCIGHRFEHLAAILASLRRPDRFGVCLDTAHVFAAGYDIRTPRQWQTTMGEFDRIIGIDRLLAVHCNDSARPLGSRIDRHAHIGRGEIGLRGFANLVNDERLRDLPLILETPKGKRGSDGRDWDAVNARQLRDLERNPRHGKAGGKGRH